jgi:hypothetical protein
MPYSPPFIYHILKSLIYHDHQTDTPFTKNKKIKKNKKKSNKQKKKRKVF